MAWINSEECLFWKQKKMDISKHLETMLTPSYYLFSNQELLEYLLVAYILNFYECLFCNYIHFSNLEIILKSWIKIIGYHFVVSSRLVCLKCLCYCHNDSLKTRHTGVFLWTVKRTVYSINSLKSCVLYQKRWKGHRYNIMVLFWSI